jgi:hypothetical protein
MMEVLVIWVFSDQPMRKTYDIIVSAEEEFARAVALGVLVRRPLTAWHYLIPGMFIIDFLKRSSEVRRYSGDFLFPRRLALDAAQNIRDGEERREAVSRVSEAVKEWLDSLKLYSVDLHKHQVEVVELLIDHYGKLLDSEGDTYYSLVKNAYNTQQNYEAYLSQLTAAEKEVDRAIVEELGESEVLREKLAAEKRQVERMRKKNVEIIFLD